MAAPTKKAAPRRIPRQLDEDDAPPPPRKPPVTAVDGDDEDDDDDETPPTKTIRRGMTAGRQMVDSTSSFAQAFRLTDNMQVIKFLEDDAYASYKRHWVERATPTGKANRSYNCLDNWGKPCPVCEAGDKAQVVVAFNIALIGDDGVPTLKTFDCGPKLFGIIENLAHDPKVAPLSKGFFLASRTGKMGTVNYSLVPIKAHSLSDDYDIDPPTDVELKALGVYDTDIITMPKTKDMETIAAEISDYD